MSNNVLSHSCVSRLWLFFVWVRTDEGKNCFHTPTKGSLDKKLASVLILQWGIGKASQKWKDMHSVGRVCNTCRHDISSTLSRSRTASYKAYTMLISFDWLPKDQPPNVFKPSSLLVLPSWVCKSLRTPDRRVVRVVTLSRFESRWIRII